MIRMLRAAVSTVFVAAFSLNLSAQGGQNITDAFTAHPGNTTSVSGNQLIRASHFLTYSINTGELANRLQNVPYSEVTGSAEETLLSIPHPNGTSHVYKVRRNETLHPDLAALFPEIQTFDIYGVSHPEEHGKIDVTPQGFHAMIMSPNNSTVFIDPLYHGQNELHMVYYKKDFITDKTMSCSVDSASEIWETDDAIEIRASYASCELRTYRLAVSATGEYTAFHGGTIALALAAQATTVNRVNGVYEKAMAIRMNIIANNNLIIYTNGASDPFTNGDPGQMITQNQNNTSNIIGSSNYDIGHVFGTNSGGLAGLGVVCSTNSKARGVTGSAAPIGDPFDIDYVAHEMGHQFAANHTQNNSCNRNNATAMEPGSASTMMGYAGICSPNVQNNSDDHFHAVSLREIGLFISGSGHNCPVKTPLTNAAPVINSTNANVTIPISTPFALTANASDEDGDLLEYNWEQMNSQATTQPPLATATGGPNFRSFPYTTSSTQYFPRLSTLASNGPYTWERLPSVSRTMNFRLTVRDNHSVSACNDFANVTITTDATAGPFVVNYPNATGIIWEAGSTQTVTWDVANTNNANVNCQNVTIYLSIDGGQSYSLVLATNTPNDGSHQIEVPNLPNTTSRVMVMAENGTFFDISDNNFQITACAIPDLPTISGNTAICAGTETTLTVSAGNLNAATNWNWYTGSCGGTPVGTGTTLTVSPEANTTYFVRGEGNCATTGPCTAVTVTINQVNNTVTSMGSSLTAAQSGATYQWLDCNDGNQPIPGATGQTFTPSAITGNYAVQITNGTCVNTSDCLAFSTAGITDQTNEFEIALFPNPTQGNLTLIWSNLDLQGIRLNDAAGRLVSEQLVSETEQLEVNINNQSSGVYFLHWTGSQHSGVIKVIKE